MIDRWLTPKAEDVQFVLIAHWQRQETSYCRAAGQLQDSGKLSKQWLGFKEHCTNKLCAVLASMLACVMTALVQRQTVQVPTLRAETHLTICHLHPSALLHRFPTSPLLSLLLRRLCLPVLRQQFLFPSLRLFFTTSLSKPLARAFNR